MTRGIPAGGDPNLPTLRRPVPTWVTRGVLGIVLATFFSDLGHEMAPAMLPMYLGAIGLGAAALGFIVGLADLAFSLSKLAGGWVGHHTEKKRGLTTLGCREGSGSSPVASRGRPTPKRRRGSRFTTVT